MPALRPAPAERRAFSPPPRRRRAAAAIATPLCTPPLTTTIAPLCIRGWQAHNIERVCTDAASFSLSSIEIAGAVREIDRVIAGSQNAGDPDQVADDEANGGELRARSEPRRARYISRFVR